MSFIALSLFLGIIFYIAEISLGRNKTLQSIMIFSFLIVFIGWIGIRNPVVLWGLRLCILLFLFGCVYHLQPKKRLIFALPKSAYMIVLGIVSALLPERFLFNLFAAGYDNSSHIGFLYRTWKIGTYEYGSQGNGKIVPAYINLANGYPSLQMESWATILRGFSLPIKNTENLLRYFFFFSALSIILLLYALYHYVDGKLGERTLLKIAITVFVIFSSISSLYWSGFPPTVWGIVFSLLALQVIVSSNSKPNYQLVLVAISIVVVLYSYQLFSPAFVILYVYLFLKRIKTRKTKVDYLYVLLSMVLVITPSYLLFRVSKAIRSYVYSPGGIAHPNILLVLAIGALVSAGFLFSKKKSEENRIFIIALVVNGLISVYLLGTAYIYKKGMYYPTKSLYLSIFLSILYIVWNLGNQSNIAEKYISRFRSVSLSVMFLFACLPLISTKGQVWAGNSVDLIRSEKIIETGSYPPFAPGCLQSVFSSVTKPENFDQRNHLIVVKVDLGGSDLVSRWANSLNGRVDNEVIEMGMDLVSSVDFDSALAKFRKSQPSQEIIGLYSLRGCSRV